RQRAPTALFRFFRIAARRYRSTATVWPDRFLLNQTLAKFRTNRTAPKSHRKSMIGIDITLLPNVLPAALPLRSVSTVQVNEAFSQNASEPFPAGRRAELDQTADGGAVRRPDYVANRSRESGRGTEMQDR